MYYIISRNYYGVPNSPNVPFDATGCCSYQCYQHYWSQAVTTEPWRINDKNLPYCELHYPQLYLAWVYAVVALPFDEKSLNRLAHYPDKPLYQGLRKMYSGWKDLQYTKIIEGLRICRTDPVYNQVAKEWVETTAKKFVSDLKGLGIATQSADVGGVQITIATPQPQGPIEQKCPSCSAKVDFLVQSGQMVRCRYCGTVFKIP